MSRLLTISSTVDNSQTCDSERVSFTICPKKQRVQAEKQEALANEVFNNCKLTK